MKRNLLILLGLLSGLLIPVGGLAKTVDNSIYCLVDESVEMVTKNVETPQTYKIRTKSAANPAKEELVSLNVQTTKEGELESILGNALLNIESLTVTGPINDDDFTTMWRATFEGNLEYIDLKDAVLSNGEVPNCAFYHQDEQVDPDGGVYVIVLKKIILPDNVKTIGENAFYNAIYLENINIPSSLIKLGKYGFYNCQTLNFEELTLPAGMETLEAGVFSHCTSLTAKVSLPSTIKHIGSNAFSVSGISAINLPANLQTLGGGAFFNTDLKEISIPAGCTFEGTQHFAYCYELQRVHLPEGMTKLPTGLFFYCSKLTDVNIPESVTVVDLQAFGCCYSLGNLRLPKSFKKCSEDSFCWMTALEEVYFPASTETIGEQSCQYWQKIKNIYCASPTPPVCEGEVNSQKTPFGDTSSHTEYDTPRDIPVYVPIGSAEAYRNAWGWDYFTNFIETDAFPTSAVGEIITDEDSGALQVFDLYGRRVETPQRGQIYIKGGKKFIQN